MSILRALNNSADMNAKVRDFVVFARHIAASRGDLLSAATVAEHEGSSPVVVSALKAAVAAGTTTDSTWAAPLSPFGQTISAFIASLRSASAFDAMLPAMKQTPLRTRTVAASAGIAGHVVGEGATTALSSLSLATGTLSQLKAIALVAISNELAMVAGEEGIAFLDRELRAAVAAVTDVSFVGILTAAASSSASSGTTAPAVLADFAAALGAIATTAESRLYALTSAPTAKALAFKVATTGELAFPQMTPSGGSIGGVTVLVTDAVSNSVIVADAAAIVANGGTITVDESRQATIQFSTTPDSPATASTVAQSLWQSNMTGIRAIRWFGAEVARSGAVAAITGVAY